MALGTYSDLLLWKDGRDEETRIPVPRARILCVALERGRAAVGKGSRPYAGASFPEPSLSVCLAQLGAG